MIKLTKNLVKIKRARLLASPGNSIFDENFRSIMKISQVGCTNHVLSKLVAEKCICRGRGVIHGSAKMRQNHPKSMALSSHVVLVLERSCYGWGHIMTMSDNIFVNKSRYGVMGSPMSRHKWWKMAKNSIFRLMAGKWGGNSQEQLSLYTYHCKSTQW